MIYFWTKNSHGSAGKKNAPGSSCSGFYTFSVRVSAPIGLLTLSAVWVARFLDQVSLLNAHPKLKSRSFIQTGIPKYHHNDLTKNSRGTRAREWPWSIFFALLLGKASNVLRHQVLW